LTYSIIAFADEPRVAGGIVDSYRRLSLGLLAGLSALGADVFQAQTEKVDNPYQGAVCFDTPSHYEITVNNKKLVGSAQVRRRGMVLQHGTLPLTGDLSRIFDCLKRPEPHSAGSNSSQPHPSQTALVSDKNQAETSEQVRDWRDWLLSRACTLQQALGREVPFHEVANALAQGFASALNLRLEPGELTDHEGSLVQRLRRKQYANDSWNRRI
jgi:lipoate-protein ligase A